MARNHWIPPEKLAEWRTLINGQIEILSLAQELGYGLEKHSHNTMRLTEHDSCIINLDKNTFTRYSQIGKNGKPVGGGPLDFYSHFTRKNIYESVNDLKNRIYPEKVPELIKKNPVSNQPLSPEKRHMYLTAELSRRKNHNPENEKMRNVFAYLTKTRKIDPEIIQALVSQKCLFQISGDKGHPQCAFVGRNEYGLICSVHYRGTSSTMRFMGDMPNCDYNRDWYFNPTFDLQQLAYDKDLKPPRKSLLCFESCIEMLSYMTILKESGYPWKAFSYLACGSVTKTQSIAETCKIYDCKEVVVMFNNDLDQEKEKGQNPGKDAAESTVRELRKKGIKAKVLIPEKLNDWNDTLRALKEDRIEIKKYRAEPDRSKKAMVEVAR